MRLPRCRIRTLMIAVAVVAGYLAALIGLDKAMHPKCLPALKQSGLELPGQVPVR